MTAGALMFANLEYVHKEISKQTFEKNPFLHLWSLGVEEQFYIIWPLLTGWIIKMPIIRGACFILILIVLSFMLQLKL